MARTVTVLPPTINRETSAPIGSKAKRKVAAYARVSTDHEEQQSSYEAQVDYYTKYIQGRDDWEFAGIFSDEGVTGTCMAKREGFNAMVEAALAGDIDLILTKSVSRFARNTVDSLTTIRKLKEHGTEVYFEKESIWTFDSKGEMLLTILSSLSQEESRSISENVKWGQRKKFSDGKFSLCYGRFLGYEKGEDGTMVINKDQAQGGRAHLRLVHRGPFTEGNRQAADGRRRSDAGRTGKVVRRHSAQHPEKRKVQGLRSAPENLHAGLLDEEGGEE